MVSVVVAIFQELVGYIIPALIFMVSLGGLTALLAAF